MLGGNAFGHSRQQQQPDDCGDDQQGQQNERYKSQRENGA
jgi:hypothetical protein